MLIYGQALRRFRIKKGPSCGIRRFIVCLFALMPLAAPHGAFGTNNGTALRDEFRNDIQTLTICREGLGKAVAFAKSRPELFLPGKEKRKRLLTRQTKMEIWTTWNAMLDYVTMLDALGSRHGDFFRLDENVRKKASFSLRYGSFLAEYRFALEFVALSEQNQALNTILDEPVPEFGLPGGSYTRFKFRFLNVVRATEFTALQAVYKGLPGPDTTGLRAIQEEDAAAVWRMGKGKGPALTFANALAIAGKAGFAAWFPVQKGVSEWMGDVKVRNVGTSFISPEQIRALRPRLHPGDILLQRREWYLSNLGLPGFWTHAALYIGSADERRAFFDDPETKKWVRTMAEKSGDLETLLRTRYPAAYENSKAVREDGQIPRVLEAISEGVSFTALEHSAAADSLAVLRPWLSKREKAEAILHAFHYSGRPYDFNFDFQTDSSLVCSELVYKVYEPSPGMQGLHFPLVEILGRKVSLPNDLARQFSEEYGTAAQQTELVLFLDGYEKAAKAMEAGVADFRRSWRRPKWHVLTQKLPEEAIR